MGHANIFFAVTINSFSSYAKSSKNKNHKDLVTIKGLEFMLDWMEVSLKKDGSTILDSHCFSIHEATNHKLSQLISYHDARLQQTHGAFIHSRHQF